MSRTEANSRVQLGPYEKSSRELFAYISERCICCTFYLREGPTGSNPCMPISSLVDLTSRRIIYPTPITSCVSMRRPIYHYTGDIPITGITWKRRDFKWLMKTHLSTNHLPDGGIALLHRFFRVTLLYCSSTLTRVDGIPVSARCF